MAFMNTSFDQISEEAYGDILISSLNENDELFNLGFSLLFDEANPTDFSIAGTCEYENIAGKINLI